MTDERYCYFKSQKFKREEYDKLTTESKVSEICSGDLTRFKDLFESESDYEHKSIAEIIFARGAAKFDVKKDHYENMHICQSHQNELFFKWSNRDFNHIMQRKPPKDSTRKPVCSFPEGFGNINHGTLRPFTTRCIVTFEEAKIFYTKEKTFVHVGLPICQSHKSYLQKLIDSRTETIASSSSSSSTTASSQSSEEYCPNKAKNTVHKFEQIVSNDVAQAIINLAKAAGIDRVSPNQQYSTLAEDTKRKKGEILKKLTHIIADYMAPDDPQSLLKQLSNNSKKESKSSKQVDHLLNSKLAEETEDDSEIDPEDDDRGPIFGSIFYCPVNGCQQTYKTFGYLGRHIQIGKHKLVPERCTLRDYALKTYIQQLEGASDAKDLPGLSDMLENLARTEEIVLKKGWAIRERAPRITYTTDMKKFLDAEFDEARNKNQRINPKIVQEKMEEAKKDGKMRFKVAERLSSIQIGRYFAVKLNKLRNEESNGDDEESEDDIYHDEPMFSDKFETLCEEIDWTTLVPPEKEVNGWNESEDEVEEEVENKRTPKKKTSSITPKIQNENESPNTAKNLKRKSPRANGPSTATKKLKTP